MKFTAAFILLSFHVLFAGEVNYVEFEPGNIPILITMPHTGDETPPDIEYVRSRPDAKILDEPWIEEIAESAINILDTQHGIKPYRVRALFARHRIDANRNDQTGPPDDNEAYEDPDAKVYYDEYHNRITAYINEILEKHGKVIVLDTHGHGNDPSNDVDMKIIYRGTRNGDAPEHLLTAMGWGPIVGQNSLFGVLEEQNRYTLIPDNTDLPGPNYQPEQIFAGGWSSELHGSENCQNCSAMQIEIGRNSRELTTERDIMAQHYAEGLLRMYRSYLDERIVDNVSSNDDGVYLESGSGWSDDTAVDNYPENSLPLSKPRITTTDGDTATYDFTLETTGIYEVYAWWSHERPVSENDPTPYPRNQNAKYTITAQNETFNSFVDQSTNGGQWNLIYTGLFNTTDGGQVVLTHENSSDPTVAEAVKMKLLSTDVNYPHQVRNAGDTSDMIIDRHLPGPWTYEEIGNWTLTTSPDHHGPYDIPDSRSRITETVGDKIIWRPHFQDFQSGYHKVYAWWSNVNPNDLSATLTRDPKATFRIYHANGIRTFEVNQKYAASQWVLIGIVPFNAGTDGFVELERTHDSAYKTVGDAIKFEFIGSSFAAQENDVYIVDLETVGLYEEGNIDNNVPDWLATNSQNNYGPYPLSRSRISRNGGDYIEWTLDQTGDYSGKVQVHTWWGNLQDDGVTPYSRDEDATFEVLRNGTVVASATWDQKFNAGQWNEIGEIDLNPGDLVKTRIIRENEDPIDRRTTGDAVKFTLTGAGAPPPPPVVNVTRGPYLQKGTASSVVVRFYTDISVTGVVRYGDDPSNLVSSEASTSPGTKHIIKIDNLAPNTKYYYSVGTSSQTLEGGDANYYFRTHPVTGSSDPVRVWLIGDSGTANSNARAVRDAYLSHTGSTETNVWIMLGDNAYDDGTYNEYQDAVFDTYPSILRNTIVWPTIGNHDSKTNNAAPYLDLFSLPQNAESGGVASGTERYYSFDYGNIHFICLDSDTSSTSSNGTMATWLENDLASTSQEWIIAFLHHPPYSKGSHDSDSESSLRNIRENLVPILEDYGVDMLFAGHSHSYERSYLLDGHYGNSSTLDASHKKDDGDGDPNGDGAYSKENGSHNGAIYVVAGSSGKTSSLDSSGPHPIFIETLKVLGSVVLDINGAQADAIFIDNNGTIRDEYRILKGPATPPPSSGTLNLMISDGMDDVEEDHEGIMLRTSNDIELIRDDGMRSDGVVRGNQTVGLRFKNLQIPQGATINSASLQFKADESQTELTSLNIRAQNIKDAPGFTTTQFDVSSRALTSASVLWDIPAWTTGEEGSLQQSPDIAAVIQEIINRPDWIPGGDVAIIITGTGKRVAVSKETDPDHAARLNIEYGNGVPGNSAPQVSITAPTAGSSYDEPALVLITADASDSDGVITLVEFFANGVKVGEDLTAPYTLDWDNVLAGSYQLTAVATDDGSTSATSASVSINVTGDLPNVAPSVSISSPLDGSSFHDPAQVVIDVAASDSDGSVTLVEFFVDAVKVGEDASAPYSFTWNSPGPGSYSLYAIATDDENASTQSLNVAISVVTPPVPGEEVLEVRVSASADDAEEYGAGTVLRTSDDLELVNDGSKGDQIVGLRFNNITIPAGAEITKAYVQFTVDETDDKVGVKTIHGEASDSASGFSTTNYDISSRPLTVSSVQWDPPVWDTVGEAGPDQQTSDLSPIIQEIVNRGGWTSGASLVLIMSGTGERVAESYNGSSANAPLLHVEYNTSGVPQNLIPTVSITAPVDEQSFEDQSTVFIHANATDADGSVLQVEFFANGSSLGVDTTAPYSVDWNISGVGEYLLTATVTDNESATSNSAGINITVIEPPPPGQVNLDIRVSASADDAEEYEDGTMLRTSDDLELVNDGSKGNQKVGMRFNNVAIPQGAFITNAYIQFTVDEDDAKPGVKSIRGETSDSAVGFSTSDFDISSRPLTSATVTWDPPEWNTVGEAGEDQRTPNLATVVQEIINRPGWNSGASLVLIMSGTGERVAESYNGSASNAPLLHLEYFSEGTSNSVPTVALTSPENAESFTAPAMISLAATASDADGSITKVEFYNGILKLGEDTTAPYTLDWNSVPVGGYVLTARAIDNQGAIATSSTVVIDVESPEGVLDRRISASEDDAEEYEDGNMLRTSDDLELVYDGSKGNQTIGLRFTQINIPQGSTINSAYVQFTVEDDLNSEGQKNIQIQDSVNASSFSTSDFDISSRSLVSTTIAWNPPEWNTIGEAGADQQTSDISSLIQTIINRPDWVSGGSVVIVITGQGKRVAESYNGSSSKAPLLHVEFD